MTKPCVACREPIQCDARKCPHCHQTQSRLANFPNTNVAQLVLLLFLAALIAFFFYSAYEILHKTDKAPKLDVSSGTIRVGSVQGSLRVSCFATITNQDRSSWRNPSLQAEFFDRAGARIDIKHQELHASLYPTFSMEGHVWGEPVAEPAEYASCVMKVIDAR